MAEVLHITVRQLIALHKGLNSLDAIKEGRDELIGFQFDKKIAWNLTKNAVLVERAMEAYQKRERASMKTHSIVEGMKMDDKAALAVGKHNEEMEVAKDDTVDIPGIIYVKLDELLNRPTGDDRNARKTNPIALSVLKNLAPIINET